MIKCTMTWQLDIAKGRLIKDYSKIIQRLIKGSIMKGSIMKLSIIAVSSLVLSFSALASDDGLSITVHSNGTAIFGEKVTVSDSSINKNQEINSKTTIQRSNRYPYLHDHFKVGDVFQAKPPAGNFHQPKSNELNKSDNSNKVLLLSAGSGITPMLAMLKAMADQAIDNDVVFFHSAKSERDLIALNEISALAKQHGNCQILLLQNINSASSNGDIFICISTIQTKPLIERRKSTASR